MQLVAQEPQSCSTSMQLLCSRPRTCSTSISLQWSPQRCQQPALRRDACVADMARIRTLESAIGDQQQFQEGMHMQHISHALKQLYGVLLAVSPVG